MLFNLSSHTHEVDTAHYLQMHPQVQRHGTSHHDSSRTSRVPRAVAAPVQLNLEEQARRALLEKGQRTHDTAGPTYERCLICANAEAPTASSFEPAVALAQLFKLLAEPNRVRILHALSMDCRPVSDLIAATELEQTNASFHLRVLREAGLVRAERRGSFIYYCLSDSRLLGMVSPLSTWISERAGGLEAAAPKRNGQPEATTALCPETGEVGSEDRSRALQWQTCMTG